VAARFEECELMLMTLTALFPDPLFESNTGVCLNLVSLRLVATMTEAAARAKLVMNAGAVKTLYRAMARHAFVCLLYRGSIRIVVKRSNYQ
jgi:hypothetical protein